MSDSRSLPTPEQDAAVSPMMRNDLQRQVFVCTATSCAARGAEEVLAAFRAQLTEAHILFSKTTPEGPIACTHCGSVGFCAIGPAVLVYPDGVWYAHVTVADVPEIIERHLKGGEPVARLVRKRLG
jgi:(2Fe-2S) ferredoxin